MRWRWVGTSTLTQGVDHLAIEAAREVIDRASGLGLPEVHAVVRPGDGPSMGVCRRLGMVPLGRMTRWYDVELEAVRLTAPVVVE
ncbi:MAG TPA: hypothetical protein VD834_04575 [Blastococcus sp.]|nr:hypothetical protein [Blastococcus sp.]